MGNERKRKLSIFFVCSFLWRQSRFSWRVELTRMDPAVAIPVTATKPSATMGIYKVQLCAQRLISQPRTPTHNYYWSYCGRNRTEKTGRENKNWTKRETDRKRERREISQGENLDTKKKKKLPTGDFPSFLIQQKTTTYTEKERVVAGVQLLPHLSCCWTDGPKRELLPSIGTLGHDWNAYTAVLWRLEKNETAAWTNSRGALFCGTLQLWTGNKLLFYLQFSVCVCASIVSALPSREQGALTWNKRLGKEEAMS